MFSDLAHSARPSAVTDPDTAARHSLPPAFPNRPSPLAPPLPRITCPRPQPLPLPPLESGLSGVLEAGGRGGAPWVWEDDRVQAEQLALECGKRRVEPHTTVGKNSCSYSQPQHVAPHQGQPTALSCLEQWPSAGCCRVSPCWEARRAQGRANHAPCASTCPSSGISSSQQARRFSPAAMAPPAPRPLRPPVTQKAVPTPLSCPTGHRPEPAGPHPLGQQ